MAERSKTARQQVDPVFKQVLLDELTPLTKALQTEIKVSRLPRTIDALVIIKGDQPRPAQKAFCVGLEGIGIWFS